MNTLSAGPTGVRQPGSVVEVDEAEGKALVAGGYADVVDAPKVKANAKGKAKDDEVPPPGGDTPPHDPNAPPPNGGETRS